MVDMMQQIMRFTGTGAFNSQGVGLFDPENDDPVGAGEPAVCICVISGRTDGWIDGGKGVCRSAWKWGVGSRSIGT